MPTQLAPTMQLIHGSAIPVLGFGTSPLQGAEAATAVRTAIETGYRLIDTAENYHNEDAVGRGIRESGIDRAELFVTSKFNRQWHSVAGVQRAHEASLDRLGLDYLDLLLVHWPNPDQDHYVDAVRGLGELLDSGALRAHRHLQLQASPSAAGAGRDRHRAGCQSDTAEPLHDPPGQPRLPH